jgi:hypothetical protein
MLKPLLLPALVVLSVAALTLYAVQSPVPREEPALGERAQDDLQSAVNELEAALHRLWQEESRAADDVPADDLPPLTPAGPAADLVVLRRLSLALHGTIPSLEEVRRFEADTRPDRLERWTAAMLDDPRFADYFAERLARACVGVEEGQFIIFRRDRFTAWLGEQLRDRRPWDGIVRDMLSAQGVWTGDGEVNFLTGAYANREFDPNKLAARTSRAFLGQRMDCAQCHDHPFDQWTQAQFEGLAAHFGKLDLSFAGVTDKRRGQYTVANEEGETERVVKPAVPFHDEWGSSNDASAGLRDQLAAWVTHPDNRRFERAIANRVWGLMFGRPFAHRVRMYSKDWESGTFAWAWNDRAVDDLPDPDDPRFGAQFEVLDLLGRDFRAHGCDLRRLVQVIAASEAFRLDSVHPETAAVDPRALSDAELDSLRLRSEQIQARWAVFPLVRLRPEQVIGAMLQANHVETIDRNSHLFVRAQRFFRERDFVDEFGDPGVDELEDRTGTIQQALLRMNGDFASDLSKEQPLAAPGQIKSFSPTPEALLDNVFLACFTRTANAAERECILPQLTQRRGGPADGAVQDLYWTLFNSPEFSWNH